MSSSSTNDSAESDDKTYAAAARSAINQAVLAFGGNPSFARTASEVFPRIYVSDIFTARTAATLRDLGITHVISTIEQVDIVPAAPGLQMLHIPIADTPATDLLKHLPGAAAFIAAALEDAHARVLVHCWQGMSRSPSVVAAYLIANRCLRADDAVALLKAKRRIVQPNSGFMRQLRQYEAIVRAEAEEPDSMR